MWFVMDATSEWAYLEEPDVTLGSRGIIPGLSEAQKM